MRRLLDVVIAGALLAVTAPLMLPVAPTKDRRPFSISRFKALRARLRP